MILCDDPPMRVVPAIGLIALPPGREAVPIAGTRALVEALFTGRPAPQAVSDIADRVRGR